MSFDSNVTRQGLEDASASLTIQHAFSKPSLESLISNYANLVFCLLVFKLFHSSNLHVSCRFNGIGDVIQKVQRHDDLINAHAVRQATFIRTTCNNAVIIRGD